jgi:transposase
MKRVPREIEAEENSGTREVRNILEELESRIDLLNEKDRAIMSLYLRYGTSYREISLLSGQHEGTIARRVKRIMQVLVTGPYAKCLERRELFAESELEMIKDHFLCGLSYADIIMRYGASTYKVRTVLRRAKKMGEGKSMKLGVQHAYACS